jgi:hypothetical protein
MFEIDNNLQKVILIYTIVSFLTYRLKPKLFFNDNGEFIDFGIGPDKTIVPYWLFTLVVGLVCYLVVCITTDDFV